MGLEVYPCKLCRKHASGRVNSTLHQQQISFHWLPWILNSKQDILGIWWHHLTSQKELLDAKKHAHTWYTQLLISLATSLPDSVVHPWINNKMTGGCSPLGVRQERYDCKPSSCWLRHQSEIWKHVCQIGLIFLKSQGDTKYNIQYSKNCSHWWT